MATVAIQVFTDLPEHTQAVIFGEGQDDAVELEVRLVYRTRTASWYMDLRQLDGTAIVLGRRITPTWAPLGGLALEGIPRDLLVIVTGPDDAVRDDLGVPSDPTKRMFIELVPRDEFPPVAEVDKGVTFTLVVP